MVVSLLYQFGENLINDVKVIAWKPLANQLAAVNWSQKQSQVIFHGNESAVSIREDPMYGFKVNYGGESIGQSDGSALILKTISRYILW